MLAEFKKICDGLASKDADFACILKTWGYPPRWTRPNNFESLVHIILEQQVSLASALAALNKLKERIGEIQPAAFIALSDDECRACYISRQKTGYLRLLAHAIQSGEIDLPALEGSSDDEVRLILRRLKGFGEWTIDVYLIFVLGRRDIFPAGDLAAVNALRHLKKLPVLTSRAELLNYAEDWKPNRTAATMMLWHYYLSRRAVRAK